MKTKQEIIHEVVNRSELSQEQKKHYEHILMDLVDEKIPPGQAFKLSPEALEYLYGQAYRYYQAGNYKQAQDLFAFITWLDLKNYKFLFGLAASYHRLKNYDKAIEWYWYSFSLGYSNPIPLYHLADCFLQKGDIRLAFIFVGVTIQLAGDNPLYSKIKARSKLTLQGLIPEIEKLNEKEKKLQPVSAAK
jgi:type III secretion system low calcium response chaperone LcrH/SycD